jgi:hypothetical protein
MEKIKDGHIILKAYLIYHDGLLSGDYNHDNYIIDNSEIVYGKTTGEAKAQGLGLHEGSLGRRLEYTDIRTKRVKSEDFVYFEGEEIKRWKMELEFGYRERTKKMEELPDDEMFYVQNMRNYVGNAVLWWGLNSSGYVTDLKKAHKYTKEEIIKKFGRGRETDVIWPASHVENAIREYVDIQGLKRECCI